MLSCSKAPVDDAANVVINYLATTDEKKLHGYLDRDSIQYIETLKKDAGTMILMYGCIMITMLYGMLLQCPEQPTKHG